MPSFFAIFGAYAKSIAAYSLLVVYTFQDALLEFGWVGSALKGIPESQQLLMALHAAIAALLPKLLFTYFASWVLIHKILKDRGSLLMNILQIAAAMIITIFLYRVIFYYYVFPVIYPQLIGSNRRLISLFTTLMAIMDIGFASGLGITMKLLRNQLTGKEREKNLLKEKLEAELKFLRHQTNPHFLFNTLNNIYALARKKSDDTAEVVMKLSKLLRFILYESKNDLITIADELKILDDYLELERIRYNQRLTITFEREIDDDSRKIAPLLLLPFVENAFKHGASESRFDSFIHIDMKLQGGDLTFNIDNTKENGSMEYVIDNIGLSNVRRQLELMYTNYDLKVNNQQNLFTVQLAIKLDSYAKV